MTPEEFADVLGWELLCRGVTYNTAELRGFAAGGWPAARERADSARWARAFFATQRLDRAFGRRGPRREGCPRE